MINNTHNYLKHYLRFLVLCVLACWKTQVAFSQSYELFVGETYTLPEPTPPAGYVDHTGTGRCTNKSDCISVSGLQIKVRKYFTGTATIEVDYNYTWTYNGKRQVSNATAYYSVSCKPTEVKLNKTSIELGIGGEFDLSYTTTPSNLEPEVEWRTSDKKIASLDYSNETVADQKEVVVYGESEGTCTIRLVCNTGYPAPECKVTVVDNYWVKADVKGNVKKGTKVTLTSIKAGAVIYYTTDGTEPTKSSTRYTSPIQINEDLTIKAKAFLGNQESKTSTFNYTVVSHLDGEQFMAKTKEGVDMSFIAKSGALEVSSGSKYKPAIDKDYSGFITIPNKVDDMRVKYISERAFYGCNITGVAFEEITSVSVKVIQAEAFRDCKNLKSVTFPHGIGLREMSFYNCESLETIAFEGWAQYYYKDTKEIFNNCNKIKDIFLYRIKTIDAIRDDCFSNQTYDEATLHVPEKLISNYKLLSGWKKFKNIVAIESEQNEKLLLSASPSGGEVPVGTKVTLTAKANGSTVSADIYYTTNGTTPTKNSTKYSSSGITINEACTLKAIAYKDGYETSDVITENYSVLLTIASQDVQVVAGEDYSLIVRADGSLWACGANHSGQFGNGSEVGSLVPQKIMSGVLKVASGADHTLILKDDGTLWGCGSNSYGQLGDGTTTYRKTPIKIMDDVLTMSASWAHTAIVKRDGTLWMCGRNEDGELGDGTKISKTKPIKVMDNVESVSAGTGCLFIVKKDKTLWTCGENRVGQLGDGTKTDVTKPKKILDNVKKVQVCHSYINFSTFIVKTDGSLWACGFNANGCLGDGTTINRQTPVHIMDNVIDVSVGEDHTLFVKEDKTLWACGNNNYGQLGDGTNRDQLTPIKVLDNVSSVSAGLWFSIAAKTDGTIMTWGFNEEGQLGDGTTTDRHSPVKIINSLLNMEKDDIFTVKMTDNVYIDFTVLSASSKTCELSNVSGSIVGHFNIPTKVNDYRVISIGSIGITPQSELTSINIPSSILSINGNPFYRCISLESITVSQDNVVYDSRNGCNAIIKTETKELISGCKNTVIPLDVKTIGPSSFNNCKGLISIEIPENVVTIAELAFDKCEDLQYVQLPANLKTIGRAAFGRCHVLPSIIIPSTVTSIGDYAFECENLLSITCSIKEPITINENTFYYNSYNKGTLYVPYGTKSAYETTETWKKFKNIVEMEKEQQPIEISISTVGYATFYSSESAYTLPNGLSAQVVTNASNSKLAYKTIADGSVSGVIPAGTAVMLASDSKKSGTYKLEATKSSASYSGTNLLRGSDEAQMTTGDGYHYKLSYGMPGTSWSDVFGWYWGADNGGAFMTEGHKAWLVVPKSATTTRGFTVDGETTGISTLEISEGEPVYYDLQGRRVTMPTLKGVYIKNGKKVMVK